ncbi:zinc finger protein 664-like isoform X2 [Pseudophryne corroboree]|uniref:zinc finger protein 664-like isoform X2 n=1 Tax=Pseudophryne corroboree TaxID=495146 RepID=UPI003081C7D9
MPRSKEISEDLRKKVIDAHVAGKGYKSIAKCVDLHRSTVRQIVHRWKKFNTIVTRPRSGRPTKTTQVLLEVTRNDVGYEETVRENRDFDSPVSMETDNSTDADTGMSLDMRNKTHDPPDSTLLMSPAGSTLTQWIQQYSSVSLGPYLKSPKDPECLNTFVLMPQSTDTASLGFHVVSEDATALDPVDGQSSQEEEMLWCDICNKCFHNEAELEIHQTAHLEETPLECEECGEIFDSGPQLEKHTVKKHGKMRYPCEICGLQYNYRSQYIIHQRAHTGEKPFCCNECGQAFGHKNSLVIHQRKHTGNTPFKCDKCGKMFAAEEALEKHNKFYFCAKCKKCFTCRALRRHMQMHA